MRSRALLLLLLTPALWPAFLPAASVETRGADGHVSVRSSEAERQGEDALGERIEAQYRSSYYYSLAQLALQQGLNADAEVLLSRAQEADPSSPLLAREHGEVLEALGHDAQAAVQLDQALQDEPKDLELRRRLARCYLRLGKSDLARSLFQEPGGADPTDPDWLRSLIGLDISVGDMAAAETRLKGLVKAQDDPDDLELLAGLLQRRSQNAEAAALYRRAVAKDPSRSTAWARLAASLDAEGNTTAALKALSEGAQAAPESSLLADQLGKLEYRLSRYQESEAAFSRVLDMDPTDGENLLYRGLSRLKLKRYADAEADFSALGKVQKDDPGQSYALALALLLQKKFPQAEAAFKQALDLNPKAEPAYIQLGYLYERQGQLDKAVKVLQQGLKALPSSEDLSLLLAAMHEAKGDHRAATDDLRQAVRRGAGDAVRFQLAVSLDKGGDFKEAESVLLALIKDAPKDAQALNYLGYSWADRGLHLPEAEAMIRRALEQEPGNLYYLDSLGWALHKQAKDHEAEAALSKAAAGIGDSHDDDEAVVFEHLAAAREALGESAGAAEARAKAQAIRAAAAAAPKKTDDEELP
jgi:tetratricopeptide (TPR) repeat protein